MGPSKEQSTLEPKPITSETHYSDDSEEYSVKKGDDASENQSVENAGVAFVKGANKRNEFFKK